MEFGGKLTLVLVLAILLTGCYKKDGDKDSGIDLTAVPTISSEQCQTDCITGCEDMIGDPEAYDVCKAWCESSCIDD